MSRKETETLAGGETTLRGRPWVVGAPEGSVWAHPNIHMLEPQDPESKADTTKISAVNTLTCTLTLGDTHMCTHTHAHSDHQYEETGGRLSLDGLVHERHCIDGCF